MSLEMDFECDVEMTRFIFFISISNQPSIIWEKDIISPLLWAPSIICPCMGVCCWTPFSCMVSMRHSPALMRVPLPMQLDSW